MVPFFALTCSIFQTEFVSIAGWTGQSGTEEFCLVIEEELIWIKKINAGDNAPFRQLYAKHHSKLFALCYRFTRSRSDAEDQLQELFMKILAKGSSFRGQSSFTTWLYRLATNHLINFQSRRRDYAQTSLVGQEPEATSERDVPLSLILKRALAELPEGFRNVFILHDQAGFNHGEIAKILQITASTSRSQLSRARLALRELLRPLLTLKGQTI